MPNSSITTISPRTPVKLPSGTVIETSGLAGTASQTAFPGGRLRGGLRVPGEDEIHPALSTALAELEIEEQETTFLDVALPMDGGRLRTTRADEQIVVEPAPCPAGSVQVILYQDESGGVSWHLPDALAKPTAVPGRPRERGEAGGRARFTIAARTAEAKTPRTRGGAARLRGVITTIGRKVLKVLVIPLLSGPVGTLIEPVVGKVERKYRQELIRSLTPENYRRRVSEPFTDWQSLDGRPALLVVHGIFSTTEGVLSQFPESSMRELAQHYGGCMIAFDQITVTRSPEENARFFLETVRQAAPNGHFHFDILCHSRGGIVSRTLAERGQALVPGNNCHINKVFFVATPNQGSVLADPEHLNDLVDTYTNLATTFPDGPVAYSIETVLAVLKLMVYTVETRLPGLASMGTGDYIADLNRAGTPPPAAYGAAAANYAPDPQKDNGFILGHFAKKAVDRIFKDGDKDVPNDLVVPFEGVFGRNGHPSFPIQNPLLFDEAEHVWHSGFFSRPETFQAIKRHFGLPVSEARKLEPSVPTGTEKPFAGLLSNPEWREILFPTRPGPNDPQYPAISGVPGTGSPPRKRPRLREIETEPARPKPAQSGPPSAVTGLPPVEIQRNPRVDFHEQVQEGETNVLAVRLEDLTATTGKQNVLTFTLPAGQTETKVGVTLSAPGFDVEAIGEPQMIVKTVRDPALERVEFKLTARSLAAGSSRREITANFWLGNSCIGAVGHRTVVVPRGGGMESDGSSFSSGFVIPTAPRDSCELAIGVQGDDEAGRPPFRITLRSEIAGEEYSDLYAGKLVLDQAGATLGAYLDQFYKKQFAAYPGNELTDAQFYLELAKWQAQFANGLVALGKKLWTFLPQRFRDEYFRLHRANKAPKSILVHSDEMILPWELLVPHQVIDGKLVELPPLGVRHVLGRWKPGLRMKPQPQRMPVRKFFVINPRYAGNDELPASEREAQELGKLFPQATILPQANLGAVSGLLTESDPGIFHFSGHGQYDPANSDLNALVLENGDTFDALLVTGSRLAAEGCPIVYLNACHAGNTGAVAGHMGGFSANFLQGGCSGVIAPYWPVDDERATDFSLELYQLLEQGTPIGVALHELRKAHPGDATYCAFSYFGDPWASLNLESMK